MTKRLKRNFRCQIEIGPYLTTERKRYVFWDAPLPNNRILTCVQLARDPHHLADEKKNPILYRNIVDGSSMCGIDADKWVLHFGGNAMFHIVEAELRRISRPMAKISGHSENGTSRDAYWHPFLIEAGHGTEQLQRWREQILYVLANKYFVRDHTEAVEQLKQNYKKLHGEDSFSEETHPDPTHQ